MKTIIKTFACVIVTLLMTGGTIGPMNNIALAQFGCSQCDSPGGTCDGSCGSRGARRSLGGRVGARGCQTCPDCANSFVPPAEEYCELNVTAGEVENRCFEVDYKTICIPKVVPPWKKDCCEPQCAEARSVKILKTKTYKCPKCNYEWNVRKPQLPAAPVPTIANPQMQIQPGGGQATDYYGASHKGAMPQQRFAHLPPVYKASQQPLQMQQQIQSHMRQMQTQQFQMQQQQMQQPQMQAQRSQPQYHRMSNNGQVNRVQAGQYRYMPATQKQPHSGSAADYYEGSR